MFIIEDESHAEPQKGEFQTFGDAFNELEKRAKIPWNEIPNRCSCTNWKECERNYQIIEYDTTQTPWKEIQRKDILTISAKGIKWITDKKFDIDQMMIDEWRQLGFYYDRDDRLDVNQWRFFGSKKGLQNFVSLLDKYTNNPANDTLSEHDHLGPYSYLKIMTWDKPTITADYIAGTIQDLKFLKNLISEKLDKTEAGQTFNIEKDYGKDNTITAKFFVMADNFDPVSMDELIVSGRQEIVNRNLPK